MRENGNLYQFISYAASLICNAEDTTGTHETDCEHEENIGATKDLNYTLKCASCIAVMPEAILWY